MSSVVGEKEEEGRAKYLYLSHRPKEEGGEVIRTCSNWKLKLNGEAWYHDYEPSNGLNHMYCCRGIQVYRKRWISTDATRGEFRPRNQKCSK